jgi:hypothetical protein
MTTPKFDPDHKAEKWKVYLLMDHLLGFIDDIFEMKSDGAYGIKYDFESCSENELSYLSLDKDSIVFFHGNTRQKNLTSLNQAISRVEESGARLVSTYDWSYLRESYINLPEKYHKMFEDIHTSFSSPTQQLNFVDNDRLVKNFEDYLMGLGEHYGKK